MRRALLLAAILFTALPARAEVMREAARRARADREAALEEARVVEEGILADRGALVAEVSRLESEVAALERETSDLEATSEALKRQEQALAKRWSDRELEFRELVGTVRTVARDLETTLMNSKVQGTHAGRPSASSRAKNGYRMRWYR